MKGNDTEDRLDILDDPLLQGVTASHLRRKHVDTLPHTSYCYPHKLHFFISGYIHRGVPYSEAWHMLATKINGWR